MVDINTNWYKELIYTHKYCNVFCTVISVDISNNLISVMIMSKEL